MKLAFLYLDQPSNINSSSEYLKFYHDRHNHYVHLNKNDDFSIVITHRTSFQETITQDHISYYFIRDEFDSSLRWWQEPVSLFEPLAKINPDIIQIAGLSLPLNFRWLRRIVGDEIKIIGSHTGEEIWAQRNLWLQQFGLRVVDGFIFQKKSDIEPWLRTSVILPRQSIFIMNAYGSDDQSDNEKLTHIYQEMLQ